MEEDINLGEGGCEVELRWVGQKSRGFGDERGTVWTAALWIGSYVGCRVQLEVDESSRRKPFNFYEAGRLLKLGII